MASVRAFATHAPSPQVAEAAKLDAAAAQQQLQDFAETLGESRELREFLMNPSIEMPQKLKVLDAIAPQHRDGPAGAELHRSDAGPPSAGRVGRDCGRSTAGWRTSIRASLEATITSARRLTRRRAPQLEAQVAQLAGAQVRASYREDAGLLGGAVVQIGSTIYDGSVRGAAGRS